MTVLKMLFWGVAFFLVLEKLQCQRVAARLKEEADQMMRSRGSKGGRLVLGNINLQRQKD